jgi:hypothetical protein
MGDMKAKSLIHTAKANHVLRGLAVVALLLLGALTSAHAQMRGGGGRGGPPNNSSQNDAPTKAPAEKAPALPPPAEMPWPRLESGSVVCSSLDELIKYQKQPPGSQIAADTGKELDCVTLRTIVGVQILDRDGPSRTQIMTNDDAQQTGWTNTYLPINPPPSKGAPPSSDKDKKDK